MEAVASGWNLWFQHQSTCPARLTPPDQRQPFHRTSTHRIGFDSLSVACRALLASADLTRWITVAVAASDSGRAKSCPQQ
jgi:hypothetical protein